MQSEDDFDLIGANETSPKETSKKTSSVLANITVYTQISIILLFSLFFFAISWVFVVELTKSYFVNYTGMAIAFTVLTGLIAILAVILLIWFIATLCCGIRKNKNGIEKMKNNAINLWMGPSFVFFCIIILFGIMFFWRFSIKYGNTSNPAHVSEFKGYTDIVYTLTLFTSFSPMMILIFFACVSSYLIKGNKKWID
jgi:hypothetical protein